MKDDYDLNELQQISVRDFKYNIMPRYLYHYTDKDYEKFSLDMLDRIIEDDGIAIDIGAHYGIYSLLAARKSKQVYAFEPVPENFEILQKNIRDNKLEKKIIPINKAVSDQEGLVEFNVTWASDSAGFYEHPNAEVIRKIKVKTNSLDNELKGVKDVSFIKIDTEGHELHVLAGLTATLKNNKNAKMLIEFNPECLVNAGSSSHALVEKILDLNYDIFALYEDSRYIVKVERETSEMDILQGQKYLNFLCLPRGSWQSMLLSCHSSEIGGAELVLLHTVEALIHRKDTFIIPFVTLPGDGPLCQKFLDLPIPVKIIPMRGWTNNTGLPEDAATAVQIVNSNAVSALAKLAADFKPQVVVTNTVAVPWAAYVANAFKIPHIWSIHEFGDLDHNLHFDYGYEASLRSVDALSSAVIVNSPAVQKHIGRYIAATKLKLLTPDVAVPKLSSRKLKQPFTNEATLRLVLSGRVSPTKGQLEAVQALQLVREAGHKAELLLVGAAQVGPYLDEIKTFCKKYNLEQYVHIVGFQDNPFDYVNLADVVLMCSANEAFGMVTVEAMLLGKPVIGSRSGGTVDLIQDGTTGLFYKSHDIQDLAKKIESLNNQTARQKIAAAAQADAQKTFPNDYYAELYAVLDKVIHQTLSKEPELTIFKDFLIGTYRQAEKVEHELASVTSSQNKELSDFSEEYNKVYAAYNDVSSQLARLQNSKLIKAHQKLGGLKRRVMNQKKSQ